MTTRPPTFLDRLAAAAVLPDDDEDARIRKATMTRIAAVVLVVATLWVVMYLVLDRPLSAAIPFGYQVVSAVSLVFLVRTKRFEIFRDFQLLLILILPFALQWSLGGFVESGAVMIWAFIGPLGALVFVSNRAALWWFLAYVAMIAISSVIEGPLLDHSGTYIATWVRTCFFAMNIATVSAVCFYLFHYFIRSRNEARAALVAEQARSERLLLNVLPEVIADRLKAGEEVIADGFDEVSVMFADLVGFTPLAGSLEATEVVQLLDGIFTRWDALADRFGLEKIKTIGDSYMVVAGVPIPLEDHARTVTEMALAMLEVPSQLATEVDVRIGIATGPVVAGVIGKRKFSYDVWGDTVNLASRMESHGVPGRICVSQETYQKLKDTFSFEERPIDVKGKGLTLTYLLTTDAP